MGQKKVIGELLEKTVANLASTGCEDIIFVHDECYSAISVMSKEFGIDVPFKYRHALQYMLEYLKEHRGQIRPLDMTVGVHVACSTRYNPEMEGVIDEIFELIGVNRPKRKYEREDGLCCGLPIVLRNKELAERTLAMNLDDIEKVGGTAVVMLCPLCIRTMVSDASTRGLDVYIIYDLIRLALGEKLPEPIFYPFDFAMIEEFIVDEERKNS